MDLGKQKEIQKHFERMYRENSKPWTEHGQEPLLDEFTDILAKSFKKAKVLDLGCGDGWISIKIANKGHRVWGIDSSKTAISQAKKKAEKEGLLKEVEFRQGDALGLPYRNNFFDAVLDRGLFHHILPENRQLYLKNLTRVLRTGSFVYLSVFTKRNISGIGQMFSKKDIEEIFGKDFFVVSFSQDSLFRPDPANLMHFILKRK